MKRVIFLLTFLAAVISFAQQKPKPVPAKPAPSKPAVDPQVFRDTTYGIRYKLPAGWVDRTKDIQQGNDASIAEVLLAIFERPPQAVGDTVNSAVIIAREDAASYPGLKAAPQYIDPLNEYMTSKGFKPSGEPSTMEIAARELVRADFVKPLNEKLNMHQATLVLLQKGQIVSFTFIGGSEDEVNDLIEALSFNPSRLKDR
jgi:hypothetical protein